MKQVILIALMIFSTSAFAFQSVFVGTVVQNATSGTPVCATSSFPVSGILSPFEGETVGAFLDAGNAVNAPVISWYGSSSISGLSEFCSNGELVEFACGSAYASFGIPNDLVGAFSYNSADMATFFGAAPGSSWKCVDASSYSGNVFSVSAFMAPTAPTGYQYVSIGSAAGPTLSGSLYNGATLSLQAFPLNNMSVDAIYLQGPLPSQNLVVTAGPCTVGQPCALPATTVTCPAEYTFAALQSNGIGMVRNMRC